VVGDETVKTHLRSIYRKLSVNDRAGAVATALREGIFR
jgi:DNA-binding NarL/FixJ family response regulator